MLTKSKSNKKGVTKPCRKLYRFCIDCASCASELEDESFDAKAIINKCKKLTWAIARVNTRDPRVSDGFDFLVQARKRIDPTIDAVKAQMNDAMEDELRIDQEAKEMFDQKWKEMDSQCNDEEVAGDGSQWI